MKDPSGTKQELIKEISILKHRIKELEKAESERKREEDVLESSLSLLSASLESTADGILIVDRKGKIVRWNQKFADMWKLPEEVLSNRDDEKALKHILMQLADPEQFIAKVSKLYEQPEESNFDQIEFTDGRVFERYTQPQRIRDTIIGRVWSFRDITERKRTENLLRQEHELYLDLVNNQPAGIYRIRVFPREQWQKDAWINPEHPPYSVDLASNRFCDILGINRQVYETNPGIIEDLIHPEDKTDFAHRNAEANAKMASFLWEGRLLVRAEILWVHLESIPRLIEKGVVLWTGILYDITERKLMEEALRESEERYRTLVENASDIVFRLDNTGHITFVNPAALRIMGYEEKEIIGRHYPTFIRLDMQEDAMKFFGRQFVKGIPNTYSEYPVIVKDGHEIWLGQNTQLIFQDGKVVAFQAVARDITDRKRIRAALQDSENRYRELSIVDDLTQLYNSRYFYHQLKMEIDRADRYGQPLTLLLLDLDDFKRFNDTYGHVEGDQVLVRLGQVVKQCLRQTDSAYRYGGEEFTILLPMTTSEDGTVTAERIRTEFKNEKFSPVPGQDVHVTVSIGIAQYKPQEEMKVFVHRVDQPMYQGKKNGKDRICCEP